MYEEGTRQTQLAEVESRQRLLDASFDQSCRRCARER